MNNIINSSGIYDINSYNLTTNKATVLSTLNIGGYIIGSGTGLTNLIYDNIINKPDLATTANLNNLSTTSTLNISNLQATSTTIFNNLNSLSTYSNLNISNLQSTSTSILGLVNGHTPQISNLNNTSTTIFNNLNSLSTYSNLNISNLQSTSTSIFNKTNFSNLIVYGDSTYLSSLNVVGNIIGSGTALTNLNYGSINNPPDLTVYNAWTKISGTNNIYNTGSYGKVGINTTTPQGALEVVGYNNTYRIKFGTTLSTGTPLGANRIYSNGTFRFFSSYPNDIASFYGTDNYDDPINAIEYFSIKTSGVNVTANLNISGTTTLNNNTTCISSLNVSGVTTLLNNVTIKGELINQYWKFTNDSDYCRLNGVGGGYFNFAANNLYSSGIIYASGDKLNFLDTLNQYK